MNTEIATKVACLEERVAWLNRHVEEQDRAMFTQQIELQQLRKLVESLRTHAQSGSKGTDIETDERPPHY